MANALYSLGIPTPVYIVLVLVSLGAIFALVYFVYHSSPPPPEEQKRRRRVEEEEEEAEEEEDEQPQQQQAVRRQNAGRRGLDRVRDGNVAIQRRGQQNAAQNNEEKPDEDKVFEANVKKLGKKKAEKLRAKEEKKLEREAELDLRKERKQREEEEYQERKRKEAEKEAERKRKDEEEENERAEREKQEEEAYNKLKSQFSVEGEGYSGETAEQKKAKLHEFCAYVKKLKVVPLEELSANFLMKTNDVLANIKKLESQGELSGVIDDRGKYIFITHEELDSVAKFVQRRGRVTVEEIASESNRLIKFPETKTT